MVALLCLLSIILVLEVNFKLTLTELTHKLTDTNLDQLSIVRATTLTEENYKRKKAS